MDKLDKQLRFFDENKDRILTEHDGRFIVISPDLEISDFPSLKEAYSFGVERFGLGNFLLKECLKESQRTVHIITPGIVLA